jgi:3-dehydroquinate dehydratase-2
MHLHIIIGPNLNLLGVREPEVYGTDSWQHLLPPMQLMVREWHREAQLTLFQSNHEGSLIDYIHEHGLRPQTGFVINAGGLSHTSIALADAVRAVGHITPTVEVHISNVYEREQYRHHSYIAAAAVGSISGLGTMGYQLALQFLMKYLSTQANAKLKT